MILIPAWLVLFLCAGVPLLVHWMSYNLGKKDGYLMGMKAGVFVREIEERGGHEL